LVFTLQPLSGTLKRGHPTLRDACIATNTTQTGSQSDATTARDHLSDRRSGFRLPACLPVGMAQAGQKAG
jgi:hypothetical protein